MIAIENEIINESYFILNKLEEMILHLLKDKEIENMIKDMVLKYFENVPENLRSRFLLDIFFNAILGADELKMYGINLDGKNIKIKKLREEIIKIIIDKNEYKGKRNKKLKITVSILINSICLMNCVRILLRIFSCSFIGYEYYSYVERCIKEALLGSNKYLFTYVCDNINYQLLPDEEKVILYYLLISCYLILNLIKDQDLNINKNSIKKKEKELLISLEVFYNIVLWDIDKMPFNIVEQYIKEYIDAIKKKEEVPILIF